MSHARHPIDPSNAVSGRHDVASSSRPKGDPPRGLVFACLVACAALWAGCLEAQTSAAVDRNAPDQVPARKVALVVGINKYQRTGQTGEKKSAAPFADLKGCRNDTELVKRLLTERLGFKSDEILLLLDQEATHERIVKEFHDWLIERAGPETEVVFWYSGHGSQAPDASGNEATGTDSTLVASDSRAPGGVDISDDEIHSLLQALCKRTERVTLVTDCCHSGGLSRGVRRLAPRGIPIRNKAITFDEIRSFWPRDVPFIDDGDPARAQPLHYVHVAACDWDEEADEHPVPTREGETVFGALTYFLAQALEQAEPHTSYDTLVRRVAFRVIDEHPQQVHAEGDLDREIFSADFIAPPPGFAARVSLAGEVTLEAGRVHGLERGTIVQLEDLAGKPVEQARVDRVDPFVSQASWLGPAPEFPGARPLRAVVTARPDGPEVLTLKIEPGEIEDKVARRLEADETLPLRIVRSDVPGETHRLDRLPDGRWRLLVLPERLVIWQFPDQTGPVIDADDDPSWIDRLAGSLEEHLRAEPGFRGLMALASETPEALSIEIELRPPTAEELQEWEKPPRDEETSMGHSPTEESGARTYRPAMIERTSSRTLLGGRHESLRVVCPQEDPFDRIAYVEVKLGEVPYGQMGFYVAVLCLSETRAVSVLYPPRKGTRDNFVISGNSLPAIAVCVSSDKNWNASRPQLDRYLVIASSVPFDPFVFSRPSALIEVSRGARRKGLENLPWALRKAFDQGGSRGASLDQSIPDLAVGALDVFVTTGE